MACPRGVLRELWWFRRTIILISTPILLLGLVPFYSQLGLTSEAGNCLYMLLLMAIFWCTEALPISVTALIPLVLSPLMGIQEADLVARNYFKDVNILFLASLIVALAIERSQLHKRLALSVLKLAGTNIRLLMAGFMLPTWFLSMWISNSATTAMMISIVKAVISELKNYQLSACNPQQIERNEDITEDCELQRLQDANVSEVESLDPASRDFSGSKKWEKTAKCLSLCICYAATCGGLSTLTGTGSNVVFAQNIGRLSKKLDNHDFHLNFASWMGFALPASVLLLVLSWLWLQMVFVGFRNQQSATERSRLKLIILREYNKLESISWMEVVTLIHFVLLAILWFSRDPGKAGGWAQLFPKKYASDGTAAMLIALMLFIMPSSKPQWPWQRGGCGRKQKDGTTPHPVEGILTWQAVSSNLCWGIVFLLGGGFALADSIEKSGLSKYIGEQLTFFESWPVWATILCLSMITAILTEFTSNVAVATIFLPIISSMALELGWNPMLVMLPVCVASSLAFMLPVATPPNALVFSTGVLTIQDMAKTGFVLNIVGILVATLSTLTWGSAMFDLQNISYNRTLVNDTILVP